MAPLRALADDLWVAEAPLRWFVALGRRMTVARLPGRRLWIHSPAPLDDELRLALEELGEVAFVVPASSLHGHRWMGEFRAAFPAARLFAAPGLRDRRRDLKFDGDLGAEPPAEWSEQVDQTVFAGHRFLEEVVFLHRSSRSLIVGDLLFNVNPAAALSARMWAWGPRMRRRVGPAPLFRAAVKDPARARESIDRMLAWDFDRLIVGHGDIVGTGGKDVLRAAWEHLPASAVLPRV